jgi:GntR family transcriptional regulator
MSVTLERGPQPLYLALRDHLREAITDRTPGDQLPSEKSLCETYSVSRITTRQALDLLVQEGLVRRVPGKGTFVATRQMPLVLTGLQGLGQLMRQSGAQEPVFNAVRTIEERAAPESVAARLRLEVGTPVVFIERVRSMAAAPLSIDQSYLPLDPGRALARLDLERSDLFLLLEDHLGHRIERIDASVEARQAEESITHDLGLAAGAPVLALARTVYSTGLRPLMAEMVCFRGDRFRFAVTLDRSSGAPGHGTSPSDQPEGRR